MSLTKVPSQLSTGLVSFNTDSSGNPIQLVYNTANSNTSPIQSTFKYSIKPSGDVSGNTDTANFINLFNIAANNTTYPDPGGGSNALGQVSIMVSSGQYYVNSSILANNMFSLRTYGLHMIGDGRGLTEIIYNPSTQSISNNSPLFFNNDKLLGIKLEGITFVGNSNSCPLFSSYSSGGAQNYIFSECDFAGTWQYGMILTGTNNNSEMTWQNCNFPGSWISFLYSPTSANNGSDQFLNYWFDKCSYTSSSSWINMQTGGSIKIDSCDVSGYSPSQYTYLFGLYGISHAQGVCSFVCDKTRFELKSNNSGLLYSEWPQGNILFDGCDTSSQSANPIFNTVTIQLINVAGPSIKFVNCSLMGTHTYTYSTTNFSDISKISYDNCWITQVANVDNFIIIDELSTNSGGVPTIHFNNCKGSAGSGDYEIFDTDYQWQNSTIGITNKKYVKIGGSNQPAPIANGSQSVLLPNNSVITGIYMVCPPGSTTNSGSYHWNIQTSETTPTLLCSVSGSNLSNGFYVANTSSTNNLFFICNTLQKRTLNSIDLSNVSNVGNQIYFLIEYIG